MEYRDIVALLVILFYCPVFFCSCWLVWRYGWRASYETWFVLSTFSISRIAYGALQLATISNSSTGLRVAAATFSVDGLSALLFCALGLLHRLLDVLDKTTHTIYFSLKNLRFLEAVVTAAFICASIGYSGLTADDIEGNINHPPTSKAAAALYLVGVFGISCSVGMMFLQRKAFRDWERHILWILMTTQPLLFR